MLPSITDETPDNSSITVNKQDAYAEFNDSRRLIPTVNNETEGEGGG